MARVRRWRLWALAGALALCCGAQAASPPALDPLGNYQHSQWTAENGVPPDILGLAQTPDGWLWLGTTSGLFRFDGVRFERVPGPLGRARTRDMFAGPDGKVYVSIYGGGMFILHPDGRTESLSGSDGPTIGAASAMTVDGEGTLWIAARGVYRRTTDGWKLVDDDPVWADSDTFSMLTDAQGNVWSSSEAGIKRLDRDSGRFERVDGPPGSLVLAPDGAVWVLPKHGERALRIAPATGLHRRPARANPSGSRFAGIFDNGGMLWKLRCKSPVCTAMPGVDGAPAFAEPAGPVPLSGIEARQIMEDREGDIWIVTEHGLDRFRRSRLVQSGLPRNNVAMSMAADADGHLWAADDDGALWQVDPGAPPRPVPGPPVTMVVPDHDGGILLGGRRSIWRVAHGRRTEIPLPPGPDGKPRDRKLFVLLDDGKVIWTAAMDTSLIGWIGGRWHSYKEFNLAEKLYRLVPDGPGQVWLARAGGELLLYDNDKLTTYDAHAVGYITGIFPGKPLVVAGDGGLGVLENGRVRLLHGDGDDVLRGVSGLIETPDGDRWLNGGAGALHVRAADWQAALTDPGARLRYETFGVVDGYPGRALIENRLPSAHTVDGRHLWFIGKEGVAMLDTAAAYRNPVRPSPLIEGVATARGMLPAGAPVAIGADVGRFGVQFTAPLLRMPERVRFEYLLEGFDADWQDAGAARTADYTRVPPGAYRFRVRAYNEDGVPGPSEAALALRVEPALTQTLWFRALAAVLAAALVVALVRYRVRHATARLHERLRVKTAERERIARALHDSFLQSLQAVMMRLDALAATLSDAPARRELEAIRAHAGDALAEGRGHLAELRAGDAADLDDTLVRALAPLRETARGVAFTLQVEGARRPLRDGIVDEVSDIAREALRNAVLHGQARAIALTLGYGRRALTLRVADDGCGIDADVARAGHRPGHWGLVGMRERAERIGGLLVIDSQPGQGTTVRLAVPARRAYRDQ